MSINRVILSGNLGAAPELRHTPGGTPVATLSIATHRRTREGDAWTDTTDWHRVTAFGKTAETSAKYLTKGSHVLVEGMLRNESWTDAETKKPQTRTRVIADRVHFVGRPRRPEGPEHGGSPDTNGNGRAPSNGGSDSHAAGPDDVTQVDLPEPAEAEIPF
jgi:single-strand DNA-binding protein